MFFFMITCTQSLYTIIYESIAVTWNLHKDHSFEKMRNKFRTLPKLKAAALVYYLQNNLKLEFGDFDINFLWLIFHFFN